MSTTLSRKELSARLGISMRTLDRWTRSKHIPYYRGKNGKIIFVLEEIEKWEKVYQPKLGKTD